MLDTTPRYVPDAFITHDAGTLPVATYVIHPPGARRFCPIRQDLTAVECILAGNKRRWFGCQSAHINSELRMVLIGIDTRDEARMQWPVCRTE